MIEGEGDIQQIMKQMVNVDMIILQDLIPIQDLLELEYLDKEGENIHQLIIVETETTTPIIRSSSCS